MEKLTEALSAIDGSLPEAQVKAIFCRTILCITRRNSFGSSCEDCEARGGNHTALGPDDSPEISVGGSCAEGQEGGEDDTSGREVRFLFAIIERVLKKFQLCKVDLARMLRNPGSRTNWPKHGQIWRYCAPRHPRSSSTSSSSPCKDKWGNSERRLHS